MLLFSIPAAVREYSGRFLFPGFEPGRIPLGVASGSRCVCDVCRVALDIVLVNLGGSASENKSVTRVGSYPQES